MRDLSILEMATEVDNLSCWTAGVGGRGTASLLKFVGQQMEVALTVFRRRCVSLVLVLNFFRLGFSWIRVFNLQWFGVDLCYSVTANHVTFRRPLLA